MQGKSILKIKLSRTGYMHNLDIVFCENDGTIHFSFQFYFSYMYQANSGYKDALTEKIYWFKNVIVNGISGV